MCDESRHQLLEELRRFRERVAASSEPSGAWELDVGVHGDVFDAFMQFVTVYPHQTWSDEVIQAMLYLVARDSCSGFLADMLAEDPDRLLLLASTAIHYAEADARWQFADRLGDLRERMSEAEPLLIHFSQDEDEYVRRRAIMALGRLGSPQVEHVAEGAWSTGDEYQRMAILDALHALGSPKLRAYLDRAMVDGRHYLVSFARKIESDGPV